MRQRAREERKALGMRVERERERERDLLFVYVFATFASTVGRVPCGCEADDNCVIATPSSFLFLVCVVVLVYILF